MARAPETGFYFEPMAERLVLVVEGSPFPTDDHWAYVGDPIEMTPEVARLECANRWPGVDPDALEVEFDLDFQRAVEEAERRQAEDAAGLVRRATELDLDLDLLFAHFHAERAEKRGARRVWVQKEVVLRALRDLGALCVKRR